MILAHHHVLPLLPAAVEFAEAAVAIAVRMLLAILFPEQFEGQIAMLFQLLADVGEVGLRPLRQLCRSLAGRKQGLLQAFLVPFRPSGHVRPAAFMRARYSWTVLWLVLTLRAIWRWPSFCSKCSRRISLIFLIDYVPGNINVMCPASLCARTCRSSRFKGIVPYAPHNITVTVAMSAAWRPSANWVSAESSRLGPLADARFQGGLLGAKSDFGVSIGCLQAGMTEPRADNIHLDPSFKKMHGCAVAPDVRRNSS